MRRILNFALVLGLLSVSSAAAQSPLELFQRALVQEQAAGNLNEAIQLYERVAREAGGDRALAARALIRAASCYEKLGNLKAGQLYQEVVRTYPEQVEDVSTARQRLAELRRVPANPVSGDVSAIVGPILNTYCLNCHTPQRRYGGIALENLSMTDLTRDAGAWEKTARRLRAGTMPPPGSPRASKAAIASTIVAIEAALDRGHAQVTQMANSERVSDMELASRIAAFLWNAPPDSALLAAVNNGTIKDPTVLQQQVRRMLADPRSERLNKFFTDWLRLDDLDMLGNPATIRPDWSEELRQNAQREFDRGRELFPEWNDELRQAMKRETQLFIDYQIRQDRPALELWTANYTFLNERMARYYGVPNVSGPQYRRVNPGGERAGLLGQASILAMTSVVNRTSPTLRGKWLFATFLGIPVPPPPPNLELFRPEGPIRKAIEAHTNAPSCRSCHRIFDPLGFALENFDARGRWRNEDSGDPINAAGTLYDGVEFSGPSQLRSALMQYRDAFLTNVTEQLLGFALRPQGRRRPEAAVHAHEMPAVRAILREAAASDFRWSSIIFGIVKSTPFQLKNIVP